MDFPRVITTLFLVFPLLVLAARHHPIHAQDLAVTHFGNKIGQPKLRPTTQDDLRLDDILLTASVDGQFHALNRTNGQIKWSMSNEIQGSGTRSLIHPMVRSDHTLPGNHLDEGDETYVIEPQSGEIFVLPPMASIDTPLERLPFTVPQLVDMSPFRFVVGDDDQRIFNGRKETSLITLNIDTGQLVSVFNADNCAWDEADSDEAVIHDGEFDDDEVHRRPRSNPAREVNIGRTDYHVSVYIRGGGMIQSLSYSVYGPNNIDLEKQLQWTRTPDDRYLQSLPDGKVMSFRTASDDPEWVSSFSKPIIAVFDVATSSTVQSPILLLQPRRRLLDLFANPSRRAQISLLPERTYVGLIGSSLFAMSHENFPLVAFSDGRGIVQSSGSPSETGSEVILRENQPIQHAICSTIDCLVGTHYSEDAASSRLSRLIGSGAVIPRIDPPVDGSQSPPTPSSIRVVPSLVADVSQPSVGIAWGGLSAMFVVACGLFGYLFLFRNKSKGKVMPHVAETKPDSKPLSSNFVSPLHQPIHIDGISPVAQANPAPIAAAIIEPPAQTSTADDGEESEQEGGEAEADGEGFKKKKRRKRGRGKKGKAGTIADDDAGIPAPSADLPDSDGGFVVISDVPAPIPTPPITPLPAIVLQNVTKPLPALPSPSFGPPPTASSLEVSDAVLGFGSHGTVVYRGAFQGRAVAVKRLLQDFVTVASREVALLQESDDHPNVIRYFYQESKDNFLYIALELCPASLEDVLQRPGAFPEINAVFEPKRALAQISAGLRHLHSLKIVHRDIKPQNILLSQAKNGVHRMLISDFGLCKKLDSDETSFMPTRHGPLGAGTVGWRAPEILRGEVKLDVPPNLDSSSGNELKEDGDSTLGSIGGTGSGLGHSSTGAPRTRLTKSVDIFALGCLFFYTLSGGDHPYGGPFDRESNILKDEKHLGWLDRLGEEGGEAINLINRMLDPQPRLRPDTSACLVHPYFWTPARRLAFLQDASDRFEIMERDPPEAGLVSLETDAFNVVGPDWHRRLDKIFIDNLGKFRKYNGKSVQDLLRALRNKKHHYQDLPENVKRHLGPLPDGFLGYFTRRFPQLFLHVYSVVASSSLHEESMFRSYFELQDP